MTNEQAEMAETPQPEPVMDSGAGPDINALKEELDQTRSALKKANAEAAQRRKKLEEIEEAEAKRKEAEMSEMEKLTLKLQKAEAQLNDYNARELKRRVAKEAGLPDAFALRLAGETEDELKEDAARLLEALPKPKPASIMPTNPGANASEQRETSDQRRSRLYGVGTQIFDPTIAAQKGGGVLWGGSEK